MSKRNKNKFASKGRKSALRVEALEQRQLLAAVTGAGTEVGSDIHHPNGNVYDQVLMTGSSVTVANDPGQVTRVSFLDLQGDIVQAEFSGAGTLTISMDATDFHTGVSPDGYNQAGVKYVQGLASFTIQGEDASTNFAVFSVGKGNAVNQALFDDTHTGGDHWADVEKLVIVADPANPNGSTFGAIYAGNAIFEGSSGTVGIAAANVNIQNGVTIGNIDASDSAVPTLVFGAASQFSNVTVAGGDLLSENGAPINNSTGSGNLAPYVFGINFVAGGASDGTVLSAKVLNPAVTFTGAVGSITTLDTSTDIDITGLDQAGLDAIFLNRTFTQNLTIHGKLGSGFEIDAAAFKGTVIFTDDIAGDIRLHDINNSNQPLAAFGGDLTFMGNLSGAVYGEGFKNITVDGDFSGYIGAYDLGDSGNPLPGGIGNVTIMGNDAGGAVYSDWNIGNIWVGGDLTGSGDAFETNNAGYSAKYVGNIGTITIVGDVDHSDTIVDIENTGSFGNVVIEGGGKLTTENIGRFDVSGLAGGETSLGTITVTDSVASATTVNFDGVHLGGGVVGKIADITITGGGTAGSAFTLGNQLDNSSGSIGNVTISGFSAITFNSDIQAGTALGNISLTTLTGTKADPASVNLDANIVAGTSIGNISIDTGDINIGVYSTAEILAGSYIDYTGGAIGDVTFTASGDIRFGIAFYSANSGHGEAAIIAFGSLGDVTFNAGGDILFAQANGSHALTYHATYAAGIIGSFGSAGAVTFTAGGNIEIGNAYGGLASGKSQADAIIAALTSTLGDFTLNAGGNIVGAFADSKFAEAEFHIYADTVSNVSFTAAGYNSLNWGYSSHANYAYIDASTAIGNVTFSAGTENEVYADIHSAGSIGNVAFTAGTDNRIFGDTHAATAIGNVSFTATAYGNEDGMDFYSDGTLGNVTFTAAYNNDVSGGFYAATSIGDMTFTAGQDNRLWGYIDSAGTLGDVLFTAGDGHWNKIYDGGSISAATAHNFTFSGATQLDSQSGTDIYVGDANLITFQNEADLDGYSNHATIEIGNSIHGIHFEGDTYLYNYALDSKTATIDGAGDAGGVALEFTNLVVYSDGPSGVLQTHTVGNVVFNGNTDLTNAVGPNSDGTFWVANDGTAAHDVIGNLTFNGTVTGVSGHLDIVASKIGDITVSTGLNQNDKVLVTDLNVFAGNNISTDVDNAGETIATDGSNLSDYTIGKITVTDTQTDGYSDTALFAGASSFDAVGGVGNVTLKGGGTAAQQTALFYSAGSDTLRITAGVFGTADNAISGTFSYATGVFNFDGYGDIGTTVFTNVDDAKNPVNQTIAWNATEPVLGDFTSATSFANADAAWKLAVAEHDSNFTKGTVSIGNIDINARAVNSTSGYTDSVIGASGLQVLSGVTYDDSSAAAIDADLTGQIGTIKLHNLSQTLTVFHQDGSLVAAGDDGDAVGSFTLNTPGYFIGTSVGKIQNINVGLTSGNAVVVGNEFGGNPGDADPDEFIVIVV